jgi:hypothetical protein
MEDLRRCGNTYIIVFEKRHQGTRRVKEIVTTVTNLLDIIHCPNFRCYLKRRGTASVV